MSALDPPHECADATNSNAARALTLAAAGLGVVPRLVSADVARLDALNSFKDCRFSPKFQGRFGGAASALDWESGMDYDFEAKSFKAAASVAQEAQMAVFDHIGDVFLGSVFPACESEIERLMAVALFRRMPHPHHHWQGFGNYITTMDREALPYAVDVSLFKAGIFIFLQQKIENYRVDFLLAAVRSPATDPVWAVVECDGHDFHERTKEQARRDKKRDRFFTSQGYRVFRFAGSEIWKDADACAAEVVGFLAPYALSERIGPALAERMGVKP